MKPILRLLPVLLFFVIVLPAHAMTVRGGQAMFISKDDVVTGTLVLGGNSVAIDGIVHGDVICAAQSVVITGTVDGDVICGAQTLRISGVVGGSVRAGAQTIEIAGPVKRNVTVVGQTLTIDTTGAVAGEILAAVQHASIDTKVGGDINIADGSLIFGDHASVAGSVHYQSKLPATLAPSATIAGTLTQTLPKASTRNSAVTQVKNVARGGSLLGKIIFYLILAALVAVIAPKRTKKVLDLMKSAPGPMMLTGFITIIVMPVIIITMVITLIGIPFAIITALVFALAIMIAEVCAAIYAGRFILERFNPDREDNMFLNILVGVPVACIIFAIPILGGLAGCLGVIWGFGAMIQSRKSAAPANRK